MLGKKQNLAQTKEIPESKLNTKVTVQYIQAPSLPSPQSIPAVASSIIQIAAKHHAEDLLEEENVEYLEEPTIAEEFTEDHSDTTIKEEEFEDLFYPNSIHCMLDLYRNKYENVIAKNGENAIWNICEVWEDISKEMQESYFEFNAEQIRQKYSSLRQQYFDVKCRNDVENFEYFEQIHEIYKDPRREIIAKGGHVGKIVSEVMYADEVVVKSKLQCDDIQKDQNHDFKSEEIVHKEHEFIDMVEKELQAMNEVGHIEELETKPIEISTPEGTQKVEAPKICQETFKTMHSNLKRPAVGESPYEPEQQKLKLKESAEKEPISDVSMHLPPSADTNNTNLFIKSPSEFTLFHYNEQQERRHSEYMQLVQQQHQQQCNQLNLLERSLKLHEKSLEQQNLLLQELIKRFPTA